MSRLATVSAPMEASSGRPVSDRTRLLLEAPVASTLLRLAAPNVVVMLLQAMVSTLDGVFVGWLGAPALAGVSLVFPLLMLMQTMARMGPAGRVRRHGACPRGLRRHGEPRRQARRLASRGPAPLSG